LAAGVPPQLEQVVGAAQQLPLGLAGAQPWRMNRWAPCMAFSIGRSLIDDQATAGVVERPVELLPSHPDRKPVIVWWASSSVWSFSWSFLLP
jgi:hypothetical protein